MTWKNQGGRWHPLEAGEHFSCRCGKQVVGKVGPRGGKSWLWISDDGVIVCAKDCPSIERDRLDAINDEMRGDSQAEQAMREFFDEREMEIDL